MRAFLRYARYVLTHKLYVFQECCRLGIPFLGIVHDLSKFLPDEWGPYQAFFYGPRYPWAIDFTDPLDHAAARALGHTREQTKAAFDVAWLLHQRRNRHHWQFWVLWRDDGTVAPLEMPERYRREMVADWRGAGRAISGTDDTLAWYRKNRWKMVLAPQTRRRVEALLRLPPDELWDGGHATLPPPPRTITFPRYNNLPEVSY